MKTLENDLLILLGSVVIILVIGADTSCIPTQVTMGDTYRCVCTMAGNFLCSHHDENLRNKYVKYPQIFEGSEKYSEKECLSNVAYHGTSESFISCECNSTGQWTTAPCRIAFGRIVEFEIIAQRTSLLKLYSDLSDCKPDTYYLIGCNLCKCEKDGQFGDWCTRRTCKKGRKAEHCMFGQFLWSDSEICVCSDLGYYIDDACLKVTDRDMQMLKEDDLAKMINNTDTSLAKIDDRCYMILRYRFNITIS